MTDRTLRTVADQTLRRLVRYGRVEVTYWNGDVRHYVGREGRNEPTLNVTIVTPRVVQRMLVNASLAVGEGYVNRELLIDEAQLPLLFKLIALNQPDTKLRQLFRRHHNTAQHQQSYIEAHYDVGNEYYKLFLDPTLTYSCAYFEPGMSLAEAQQRKIEHLLRKLQLKKGVPMRVLDIGCGWGHLAVTAAKQYGVEVLGITLSTQQLEGAKALAEREGVSNLVSFELRGYQKQQGQFDRIISVGMFEHVGRDNQQDYFEAVARLLRPGGISVLHTITQQYPRQVDAWTDTYIFPGGFLPTVGGIEDEFARFGLWSIDRENMWWHYAETLRCWRERHQANQQVIADMFDDAFYRMRDLWLAASEAGFRYGQLGLNQFVVTRGKPENGTWPHSRSYLYH